MSSDAEQEQNPFAQEYAGPTDPAVNPYAPTSNVSETEGFESDPEAFRRHYLTHEASVKSVGTLYLLGGVFMTVIFLIMFVATVAALVFDQQNAGTDEETGIVLVMMLAYGLLGALQLYGGWGLRKLKQGPRRVVTLLSVLGLLAVPFGTLINAYFLFLLHGQKGKVVFSDAYQEVIRQTPHIKYKGSTVVKVLVVILLVVVGMGLLAALFTG